MLVRTLSAETLKLRRTPALFLAVGVPLALCLLMFLLFTLSNTSRGMNSAEKWNALISSAAQLWTGLMLPLGVAILAALTVGLEWNDHQWKQVLTLPPSRGAVYLGKLLSLLGLVLLGSGALVLGLALVGSSQTGWGAVPWPRLLELSGLALLGALPLLALQVWLSSTFANLALPVGLGLAGTVAGTLAMGSSLYWHFVPWTYPTLALRPSALPMASLLSLSLTLCFVGCGLWMFRRRDIR